jgi:DNA-binding NarL/FixJ family response regulator
VLIVGESVTGEDAVVSAGTLQPHVVLMDINIPLLDGIAATRMIKTRYPQIAVIGLTTHAPDYLVYAMTKAGASEVVTKDKALDLYEVMQRALAGPSGDRPCSADRCAARQNDRLLRLHRLVTAPIPTSL